MKLYTTCLIITSLCIFDSITSMEQRNKPFHKFYANHDATHPYDYKYYASEIYTLILNLIRDLNQADSDNYKTKFERMINLLEKPDEIGGYNSDYKKLIRDNLTILLQTLKKNNSIHEYVEENLDNPILTNITQIR